jgi:hypothetical protein
VEDDTDDVVVVDTDVVVEDDEDDVVVDTEVSDGLVSPRVVVSVTLVLSSPRTSIVSRSSTPAKRARLNLAIL